MKKTGTFFCFLFYLFSLFAQEEIPYTLYIKDGNAAEVPGMGYLYAKDEKLSGDTKTLPPKTNPSIENHTWYFIPVGGNEPGKYYIKNGNKKFLRAKNSMEVELSDNNQEEGSKWFIVKINDNNNISRILSNCIRLYVEYSGKNYALRSTSKNVQLIDTQTSLLSTFYIQPLNDNLLFNPDMELISTYAKTNASAKPASLPITDKEDFSSATTSASDYFPYDFKRENQSKDMPCRARLIHSRKSSAGEESGGFYFVRLQAGDIIEKVIDNEQTDDLTFLRLRLKLRSTQAGISPGKIIMKNLDNLEVGELPVPEVINSQEYDYHNPDAWYSYELFFSINSFPNLSIIQIVSMLDEGEYLDVDDFQLSIVDAIPGQARTLKWNPQQGEQSTRWNEVSNWTSRGMIPMDIPDKLTTIVLTSGQSSYPVLNPDEENLCAEVVFEPGAQLSNQFYLDYDSAKIDIHLKTMVWHEFSPPLKQMYSGDYLFDNANPITEMRLYKMDNPDTGMLSIDWSDSFATTNYPLSPDVSYCVRIGKVFYSVVDKNGADMSSKTYIDIISLSLPKQNPSFSFFDEISKKPTGKVEYIPEDGRKFSHRFVYESGAKESWRGNKGNELISIDTRIASGEGIVKVGNPFMTYLDFNQFYAENYRLIYPEYKILVGGNEYLSYSGLDENTDGIIDSSVVLNEEMAGGLIAPMSSFSVKTRSDYDGVSPLVITREMNVLSLPSDKIKKTMADNPPQSLRIDLWQNNETGSSIVLFSEQYDNQYIPEEDSRKMTGIGIDQKPVICSKVNEQYLEVNRMQGIAEALPLSVICFSGGRAEIHLSGIKSIPDNEDELCFVDIESGIEKRLDSNDFSYPFFPTVKGVLSDRFMIIRKSTAIDSAENNQQIQVHQSPDKLYLYSADSDILSVSLYNVSGNLLYRAEKLRSRFTGIPLSSFEAEILLIKVSTSRGDKYSKLFVKKQ